MYAVDHDQNMIDQALSQGLNGVTFLRIDGPIPLPDTSVDGAISMNVFIEIHAKGEEHVIGVHGLAIGKLNARAQSERVLQAVSGDFPGFGQRRFGELRGAIDVYEVGLHHTNYFARDGVGGDQGIESFRLAAER